MKNCPNKEKNLRRCNCTYSSCEKKGYCCECLTYHQKLSQLPACFFPPDIEKEFDRSVSRFLNLGK